MANGLSGKVALVTGGGSGSLYMSRSVTGVVIDSDGGLTEVAGLL